ncbi:MAG: helix-hairpin-helix domain-containing protein, partial [Sneathiellales bacterium]|nr:helix-hairpin-helix domain-containing protein [Sneathiellales bacterium]
TEGFTSIEEIMYEEAASIAEIEGFDEEIAEELIRRAQEFVHTYHSEMESKRQELGVSDDIVAIEVLTPPMIVALGEAGVKELDDLADLSGDELVNSEDGILREFGMDMDTANDIVMAARAHWFDDEETDEAVAETEESGAEDA